MPARRLRQAVVAVVPPDAVAAAVDPVARVADPAAQAVGKAGDPMVRVLLPARDEGPVVVEPAVRR